MDNGKTDPNQTRTDEELWALADDLLYTHGWNFWQHNPGLNTADNRRIFEVADSCNTCGVYHDPCEFDEEGDCDSCACGREE